MQNTHTKNDLMVTLRLCQRLLKNVGADNAHQERIILIANHIQDAGKNGTLFSQDKNKDANLTTDEVDERAKEIRITLEDARDQVVMCARQYI